jgi:VanZ family protein
MWKVKLVRFTHILSLWLFWPGVGLITWGELAPQAPQLGGLLGWDKAQHFTAYFGLAGMATTALGPRRILAWALLGIIAFSGALEILQGYTGRDPDIFDFIANSTGAFIGLGTGLLFLWLLGALVAVRSTD